MPACTSPEGPIFRLAKPCGVLGRTWMKAGTVTIRCDKASCGNAAGGGQRRRHEEGGGGGQRERGRSHGWTVGCQLQATPGISAKGVEGWAQTGLGELPRLSLNLLSSCLSHASAGMTSVRVHARLLGRTPGPGGTLPESPSSSQPAAKAGLLGFAEAGLQGLECLRSELTTEQNLISSLEVP